MDHDVSIESDTKMSLQGVRSVNSYPEYLYFLLFLCSGFFIGQQRILAKTQKLVLLSPFNRQINLSSESFNPEIGRLFSLYNALDNAGR